MGKIDDTSKQLLDYNIKRNTWAIAAVVSFVLCVASVLLFGVIDNLIVFGIMGVLAIACFFFTFKIREAGRVEQFEINQNPEPLDHVKLEEGLPNGWIIYGQNGLSVEGDTVEAYAMSASVNKQFSTIPLTGHLSDSLYAFPDTVLPYVPFLKEARNKELSKYAACRPDKAVVGLASNINDETFKESTPSIRLHNVTRHAVQVTDDAFNKVIINKKDKDAQVYDGRQLALDADGHLLPFDKSKLANEVDILSLIISNDGYIMFAKGTSKHPLRPGKVIASAACSLLPEELIDGAPLQQSMLLSIHNKIAVLYDFPASAEMRTSFCGMSRIIARGGSPEFYCLTYVDLPKSEIVSCHNDPTSTFEAMSLESLVPELEGHNEPAAYIAKACKTFKEKSKEPMSLSASALITCIELAMSDTEHADKILKRLGIIEGYVPTPLPTSENSEPEEQKQEV